MRFPVTWGWGGELTASVALGGQPRGCASSPALTGVYLVITSTSLLTVSAVGVLATVPCPWKPTCVAVSGDGKRVAVGGEDKFVHFFSLDPRAPASTPGYLGPASKEAHAPPSCASFSPDGTLLAVGDAGREVRLYATASRECTVSGRWMEHTTRVTGLRWSPGGGSIASVASDRRLVVWDPAGDTPRLKVDLAHAHPFAACTWASEKEIWMLGIDGVAVKKSLFP